MTERSQLMKKLMMVAAMAVLMSGCVAHSGDASHRKSPPQDPADYHGVPTDDRPPVMLETPPRR